MNKIRLLFIAILAMLLFTGCSASKELTIKNKKLSEEEMDELQSAEGFNGVYFEFGGEIPENHIVNITLEQYEKGEFVAERALMPMEGSFEDNREIQFGSVLNSHEDNHEATLILETPGGGFTAPIGEIEGAFSWSEMIDKKVEIELNEPTFLAFWISDDKGKILGDFTAENDYADLKDNDQCFLLKVELIKQ